jgi:hypothetical protein
LRVVDVVNLVEFVGEDLEGFGDVGVGCIRWSVGSGLFGRDVDKFDVFELLDSCLTEQSLQFVDQLSFEAEDKVREVVLEQNMLNKLREDNFVGFFCGDCRVFVVGFFFVFFRGGKLLLRNDSAFDKNA